MISVVFVVSMVNLVVGFALAIALERRVVLYVPQWRRRVAAHAPSEELPDRSQHAVPNVVLEQVPDNWLTMLARADAEFRTFTEASVHILNLEVDTYRNDLLDIEDLVRSAVAKQNPQAIHDAVQELVALNEEWVTRQRDAVQIMVDKREELGAYRDLGDRLESLLVEQSPEIDALCQAIVSFDPQTDEEAGEKIVRELTHLARLAHDLRDALQDVMAAILVREDRIESSDRRKHVDPITGLRNRLGVEYQLHKWWREDPDRQRHMSVALIDFERLGKTNEFAGTRMADHLLHALAQLLKHQVGRDSSFDRVFRCTGHQFLVFFGDVGHSTATTTVERMRQTVETTRFEYKGKQYSLTIRAGVTAVRPEDGTEQLLQRLAELVAHAQRDGGNRTCTDDRSKISVVPPGKKAPEQRTVTIE